MAGKEPPPECRGRSVPGDTVFALGALVLVAFVFWGRSRPSEKELLGTSPIPAPMGD